MIEYAITLELELEESELLLMEEVEEIEEVEEALLSVDESVEDCALLSAESVEDCALLSVEESSEDMDEVPEDTLLSAEDDCELADEL